MADKIKDATEHFKKGFYCSQALLLAHCGDLGLDRDAASRIACGFGAGMGRTGNACGAVTGAYMVIGLRYGNTSADEKELVERTFAAVREFDRLFIEKHGSTECRTLLGIDLLHCDKVQAGERVKGTCAALVKDAAEILESLL